MHYKVLISLVAAASFVSADSLVLRDGSRIDGTFVGGDGRNVRFAAGDHVTTYSIGDIRAIEFSDNGQASNYGGGGNPYNRPAPPPAAPPPPQPPPNQSFAAPASAPTGSGPIGVELPAGTNIVVRLIDSVDSETDRLGQTYRASVSDPVVVNGQTVIPRGADAVAVLVSNDKAGKIAGKTSMTLDLQSVTVDGQKYDIATGGVTQAKSRTAQSAKVIGGTAALGAIIGGIAGGGKGAAVGTLAGAGAGTAAEVYTSGTRVKIPSETRLTFTLSNPLDL